MSVRIFFLHLFTCAVSVNLICAQQGPQGFLGLLPFFGKNNNNHSSSPFGLGSFVPGTQLPSIPSLQSFGIPSFGSRAKRSPIPRHNEYLRAVNIVGCNYLEQGPTSCASCRQTLKCFRNNFALLRDCQAPLQYCNSGLCSSFPGSKCADGSSSNSSSTR